MAKKNEFGIFTQEYSQAIGNAYYHDIKALIKKYYAMVSDEAIEEYIRTGNFAQLTARELLAKSGLALQVLEEPIQKTATKFITSIELQSNSLYRKAFKDAFKPIPEQLVRPALTQETKNLVSQQVQKIKNLCTQQYTKIDEALQDNIVQHKTMKEFKEDLRNAGVKSLKPLKGDLKKAKIANEKRIKTIAQNQLRYATNMVNINNAIELGIEWAIWRHPPKSVYKTEGRPSHIAADGKKYKLTKGCKIDGEFIQPAQLPNCKCFYELIIT